MSNRITTASTLLREQGQTIAFAESCTGGLLCAAITELAGASTIFDRGFVTYSNAAKQDILGVTPETLRAHGAVSHACAKEMATGALENSAATISIAVTGIAGPDTDDTAKPVGLVYIALATKSKDGAIQVQSTENNFTGTRQDIRKETQNQALTLLIQHLESTQ